MQDALIQQRPIPSELIGPLKECDAGIDDPAALQRALQQDGYVFLRSALDADEVLSARAEVFGRLAAVGEIAPPAIDGIATGESRRRETAGDLDAFWKSVSEGPALRRVSHGARLRDVMQAVLGAPARPHDMIYLRPAAVGRCTRLHYDYPFFAGRSNAIHTAWIPLGDAPVSDGPLVVIEGSRAFSDLLEPIQNIDYTADRSNDTVQSAAYERQNTEHPITLVGERGARFLTTDFRLGDLMIFSGFLMHGSLDNQSPRGRVRLSVDVRYQPSSDPADDPRYFGPNPSGSNGGGYGDMKAARPITEPW